MREIIYTVLIALLITPLHVGATGSESFRYKTESEMGVEYLLSVLNDEGKFDYEYNPILDTSSPSYNILRHAGTVYSMIEVYERTRDPELLDGIERSLTYLTERMKECPGVADALCVVERNQIKLGGNGLTLLAFASYEHVTGDKQYREIMEQLAKWIVAVQDESGDFTIHIQYTNGSVSDFRSEYYPGEAMYGLMRLYALDGNETWYETAKRGALYILQEREDIFFTNLPHDHWLLYALRELHLVDQNDVYTDHARKLIWAISFVQQKDGEKYPGGFYTVPRTSPTATRVEGLNAAYRILSDSSDTISAAIAKTTAMRGAAFLASLQYDDERIRETGATQRAYGGFPGSVEDPAIRIDYVQHTLSALGGI